MAFDEIALQIKHATTSEQLRNIYHAYPECRNKIEALAVARKEELNAQIINQTKISNNGLETR